MSLSPENRRLTEAVRAAHKLFEDAQLIQGMACVPCAEVFGWTVKHAAAINVALAESDRTEKAV